MQRKVAVITGASSGIGKACVIQFLKEGFAVVAASRNADKLSALKQQCGNPVNLLVVTTDVSDEVQCKSLIKSAVDTYFGIDVLVNNAGLSMRALLQDTDLKVLHKLMDVNFWGTVYCTRYALPELLKSKGSIVGVSSIAGKKGLPGRSGYSASKFAMEGFLETVRMENLKTGLHVLVACPGFTNTEIRKTALGADGVEQGDSPREESKMMSADEVAGEIAGAVKHRKRDLILTGNGKLTVFMNKFFPALTDRLVYKHLAKESGSPFK